MNNDFGKVDLLIRKRSIKRLIQLSYMTQAILVVAAINNLLVGAVLSPIVLFCVFIFLFCIPWLVSLDKYSVAVKVLIYSITTMLGFLAWQGFGIFDPALIGFCTVLVYSSIVGSKKLLISLITIMSSTIIIIVITHDMSISYNFTNKQIYGIATDTIIALASVGVASWLLHSDNLYIINELNKSHQKNIQTKLEVEFNATHDSLTGLYNRSAINSQFSSICKQCKKEQSPLSILYVDLDNLKNVNTKMGHVIGDEILITVATRLSDIVSAQYICRYGGDKFLILLEGDKSQSEVIAKEILLSLSEPIAINDIEVISTCSIGIAVSNESNHSFEQLIIESDSAMYKSKHTGKNQFQFFDPIYYQEFNLSKKIADSIIDSISNNDFELHYQPKINLETNKIQGFEALIRWNHPDLGSISPVTFIPLSEKNGSIIELGQWIINEACTQTKKWVDAGYHDFNVAINVSSVQFHRGNVDKLFRDILEKIQLDSKYIQIEITESLLLDDNESDSINLSFENIKKQGIQLSIDDFGTGYSNMGYLKKLDIKYLKIDRTFIQNIQSNPQDLIIVKAIIQLAKNLDIKTVAEGVESLEISKTLKELECDIVQGFYYSKPASPDIIEMCWSLDNTWIISN